MAGRRRPIDKVIATMVLTIAAVIAAVAISSAVYPTVSRSSNALVSAANKMDDRIKSQVVIVQATGELDSDGGWQDTNGDGDFDVFAWVKNVGSSRIIGLERSDIFFDDNSGLALIPYVDYAEGNRPYWEFEVANGTEWAIATTIKVTIHFESALPTGSYYMKMAIPNGISHEVYFSM